MDTEEDDEGKDDYDKGDSIAENMLPLLLQGAFRSARVSETCKSVKNLKPCKLMLITLDS